jgi:hypothetical protein
MKYQGTPRKAGEQFTKNASNQQIWQHFVGS